LTKDRDVVNGMTDFLFVFFPCAKSGQDEDHRKGGEKDAWEHGLGF